MHRYLVVLILLLIAGRAQGLPSCPEVFSLAYDECEGDYRYDNGDRYRGEWKKGEKHGFCTYVWTNGHRYEGQWLAGQKVEAANILGRTVTGMWASFMEVTIMVKERLLTSLEKR